ncbi:hypothetical protein F5X96DRAFT_686343 [Biscogniauxia mediterranea]|nr:hypothetical protein F5X96DRAFT_686343 [Biscogniauxia mediterranea]
MGTPVPNNASVESFASRMNRAQDAVYNAIIQENNNRIIITGFGIFDFDGMDSLTSTDVKAFCEIISHYSKSDHLSSHDVLLSLCIILAEANGSWKEFTREKGPVDYEENKDVFWYMLWEKCYSGTNFIFANYDVLMNIVWYYTTGFQNLIKRKPIFHNTDSTEKCLCICRMAQWLQATEGIKFRLSADIEGMNYTRKRPRVSSEGQEDQHQSDRAQLQVTDIQDLEHTLENVTKERDEAVENYNNAFQALGRANIELQALEEKFQKSELKCTALRDLLNEAESKDQAMAWDSESEEEELERDSEDDPEIIRMALKAVLRSTSKKYQTSYLTQIKRLKDFGNLDVGMIDHYKHCLEDEVASNTLPEDAKARCSAVLQDWD